MKITSSATPFIDSKGRQQLRLKLPICGEHASTLLAIREMPQNWLSQKMKSLLWTHFTFLDSEGQEATVLVNINSAIKRLGVFGDVKAAIRQGMLGYFISTLQSRTDLLDWRDRLFQAAPHLSTRTLNQIVSYA